ncbi:MAG: DUF523 and DUF1722 domain-containing protein [Alphaproteobacteria bacterium]|uniref:DUF523 and DUF1722 domain-containing protein n=1 Tax=Candidatus Nitrobium versatile TaxID=2884831 RepID=A0A953JDW4_9BACT|nr:DUF523 and DUF1722 domain-containing protein [Candidatus Nitrobium versatile]
MDEKIRLGISACLLGEKVRYDAGHKLDRYLRDTIGRYVEWVPVCPEVEYGLPVPREPLHLVGDPAAPRLVTLSTGIDHTEGMREWAQRKLEFLEGMELCGFVFKSKSPSSGMRGVKVCSPSGVRRGAGVFAGAFMKRFPLLPVEDEERLHDPAFRENFIERVFVFKRWKELVKNTPSAGRLVDFHTGHKLLILSHSTGQYTALGRLVADAKKYRPERLYGEYGSTLMEGLKLLATPRKNTNVLQHIMGYFKRQLTADERKELQEMIARYHAGLLPLVVPVVLLGHYAREFNEPYLKRQLYLNPHPLELMLRNHV